MVIFKALLFKFFLQFSGFALSKESLSSNSRHRSQIERVVPVHLTSVQFKNACFDFKIYTYLHLNFKQWISNSTLSSTGLFSTALWISFCVCDFLCEVGGKKEVILKVHPERSYEEDMGCVRQDVFWFNPFRYEF